MDKLWSDRFQALEHHLKQAAGRVEEKATRAVLLSKQKARIVGGSAKKHVKKTVRTVEQGTRQTLRKMQQTVDRFAKRHASAASAAGAVPPQTVRVPKPRNDDDSYDEEYFQDWMDALKAKIQPTLPEINDPAYLASLQTVQAAAETVKRAASVVSQLQQEVPVNEKEVATAQVALDHATAMVDDCLATSLVLAQDVLMTTIQPLLDPAYDVTDLQTFILLQQATPKGLADWCSRGETPTQQLVRLLGDTDLQRVFLAGGGAKGGQYGRAMEIYSQLLPPPKDAVLQRLALAVALELAVPVRHVMDEHCWIDPMQRYIHLEQAYLYQELDPAFEQFSVWELRHVVNCAARDEELGWGRQSLMNYRPDLVLLDDPQWRYCRIVRTDVSYNTPVWYKEPRSYDQVLAGGGKCGPRAWYGRFACQVFGIPTWGVQQPGHAAMSRWTTKGWMICLGAGFQYSFWEGRGGRDFYLETQARNALKNDNDKYVQQVTRLAWVAALLGESNSSILQDDMPSPDAVWYSLELFQRKCLAEKGPSEYQPPFAASSRPNRIQSLLLQQDDVASMEKEERVHWKDGIIVVPAASCTNPSPKLILSKSFLGGRQVFVGQDGFCEYRLRQDDLPLTRQTYELVVRFNTVHRDEQPLLLTVSNLASEYDDDGDDDEDPEELFQIPLPYTMGLWEVSQPVRLELGGRNETILHLQRQGERFGIALKDLQLTPVQ